MSKVKLDRENDIDRIVYFKKDGFEYVLLEAGGKYDVLRKEEFPRLASLAQLNKNKQQKGEN